MSAREDHDAAVGRARSAMLYYSDLHGRAYKDKPLEEGMHDLIVDLLHASWQTGAEHPGQLLIRAGETFDAELRLLG